MGPRGSSNHLIQVRNLPLKGSSLASGFQPQPSATFWFRRFVFFAEASPGEPAAKDAAAGAAGNVPGVGGRASIPSKRGRKGKHQHRGLQKCWLFLWCPTLNQGEHAPLKDTHTQEWASSQSFVLFCLGECTLQVVTWIYPFELWSGLGDLTRESNHGLNFMLASL